MISSKKKVYKNLQFERFLQNSGSRNTIERTPNGRAGKAAESGTLRRHRGGGGGGGVEGSESQQQLHKQPSHSSGDRSGGNRTIISKQSSTESGPSSSNRLSRQSSSDNTTTPAAGRKQQQQQHSRHNSESYGPNGTGQSWQGTPRNDVRRSGTPLEQTTSLPRRFHHTNSLDGNAMKRRQQAAAAAANDSSTIPLIEYHLGPKLQKLLLAANSVDKKLGQNFYGTFKALFEIVHFEIVPLWCKFVDAN